jgi:membrane protein implicated in regulation of membrane protease activity
MPNFQSLVRTLGFAAVWLSIAAHAFAQPASSGSGSGSAQASGMDYTFSYVIVILAVVLGVMVIARTSNRRDRQSVGGYVEKNIMKEE